MASKKTKRKPAPAAAKKSAKKSAKKTVKKPAKAAAKPAPRKSVAKPAAKSAAGKPAAWGASATGLLAELRQGRGGTEQQGNGADEENATRPHGTHASQWKYEQCLSHRNAGGTRANFEPGHSIVSHANH